MTLLRCSQVLALVVYLFADWMGLEFITTFVICILLLAFDFWTVKNVTGRLMVGLRWWNSIKDDGSNEWVFESHPEGATAVDPVDSRIFWTGLYAVPIAWCVSQDRAS